MDTCAKHKLEPRYDEETDFSKRITKFWRPGATIPLTRKTYLFDICVHCGMKVRRREDQFLSGLEQQNAAMQGAAGQLFGGLFGGKL